MQDPRAVFLANGKPFAGGSTERRAIEADVVVNGETVPKAAIAAETQNHDAPRAKPGIAWRKAANAVAVRTLLLQEGRRQGLRPAPQRIGPGRYETDEEALIRELLEASVHVDPPTESDVRDVWERDPSRFRSPPLWEVSHILCACNPQNETHTVAAHSRAVGLADCALANPNGFAKLAHDNSDCGSRSSGGALGQLGPGDTAPEFESALWRMSEGEITDQPVLSRHGWHVIRLDAVAEGAVLPYQAVREKISEAMEKACWARAARHFVSELVASAEISGTDLRPT